MPKPHATLTSPAKHCDGLAHEQAPLSAPVWGIVVRAEQHAFPLPSCCMAEQQQQQPRQQQQQVVRCPFRSRHAVAEGPCENVTVSPGDAGPEAALCRHLVARHQAAGALRLETSLASLLLWLSSAGGWCLLSQAHRRLRLASRQAEEIVRDVVFLTRCDGSPYEGPITTSAATAAAAAAAAAAADDDDDGGGAHADLSCAAFRRFLDEARFRAFVRWCAESSFGPGRAYGLVAVTYRLARFCGCHGRALPPGLLNAMSAALCDLDRQRKQLAAERALARHDGGRGAGVMDLSTLRSLASRVVASLDDTHRALEAATRNEDGDEAINTVARWTMASDYQVCMP